METGTCLFEEGDMFVVSCFPRRYFPSSLFSRRAVVSVATQYPGLEALHVAYLQLIGSAHNAHSAITTSAVVLMPHSR